MLLDRKALSIRTVGPGLVLRKGGRVTPLLGLGLNGSPICIANDTLDLRLV